MLGFQEQSDEHLMEAMGSKDLQALECFYNRHRVIAYSLALRILGDRLDAEEVIQEAFLTLWRAAASYSKERSSPRSWLFTIVRSRAIDRLRSRGSRPSQVALQGDAELADKQDVWTEVAGRLDAEEVRAALERLPAEQREAIEFAYFKGFTHVQIAEEIGVPLGTVKGRMRMALQKLRQHLDPARTELAVE